MKAIKKPQLNRQQTTREPVTLELPCSSLTPPVSFTPSCLASYPPFTFPLHLFICATPASCVASSTSFICSSQHPLHFVYLLTFCLLHCPVLYILFLNRVPLHLSCICLCLICSISYSLIVVLVLLCLFLCLFCLPLTFSRSSEKHHYFRLVPFMLSCLFHTVSAQSNSVCSNQSHFFFIQSSTLLCSLPSLCLPLLSLFR